MTFPPELPAPHARVPKGELPEPGLDRQGDVPSPGRVTARSKKQ